MSEASYAGLVFAAWLSLGYLAFVLVLLAWGSLEKVGKRKRR